MDKLIFQEIAPEDREREIKHFADKLESFEYREEYAPGQFDEMREKLTQEVEFLFAEEEAKKIAMKEFSDSIKDKRKIIRQLNTDIRNGGEWVKDTCFVCVDIDEKQVGYYNKKGKLVHTRRAKPEELQKTIEGELRGKIRNIS